MATDPNSTPAASPQSGDPAAAMSPSWKQPIAFLQWATTKYPYLQYVWVAVVIFAACAVARLFGLEQRAATVIALFGYYLLVNYFIYRRVTALSKKDTTLAAKAVMWFSLAIGGITSLL